jgi:hypothetical protein
VGRFLGIALYWLALAHLERGELDAAGAALDLSGREQRWQNTYMWAVWRVGRGRVALAGGEYREALDELCDVGERLDALGLSFLGIAPWHGPAALAAAALGERETARRLAGRELEMARTFANPRALGGALRASGLVEGGTRGVELLGEAVAVLESSPAALERARALVDMGALLRSVGRVTQAQAPTRTPRLLALQCRAARLLVVACPWRAHGLSLLGCGHAQTARRIDGPDEPPTLHAPSHRGPTTNFGRARSERRPLCTPGCVSLCIEWRERTST